MKTYEKPQVKITNIWPEDIITVSEISSPENYRVDYKDLNEDYIY